MSEHWKSTPKYWCKHCSTYVKDTSLERKQHESTGKHQGNLKRFLNGIQKDHTRNEREKDRVKAEVERLNRVAGAAPSTVASATLSTSSVRPTKSTPSNLSAADQKRQWTQLAEMGIAIPDHARSDVAMPGDWQTLSRKRVSEPEEFIEDKLNIGVRKRKFEGQDEEEEAGDTVVRRGWGSATKAYPTSEVVSSDLDSLLALPVNKKRSVKEMSNEDVKTEPGVLETQEVASAIASLVPSEQAASGKHSSRDFSTSEKQSLQSNISLGDDDHQGVSAPLFKKRKPRQSHHSNIT